jgi:hypothetical protein
MNFDITSTQYLEWTQNNSELELHHSKRGREDGKGKGEQDCKESVWECILLLKKISPFNFDTIDVILIRLLHYTVFCEPKEL